VSPNGENMIEKKIHTIAIPILTPFISEIGIAKKKL
jgi:hypothetical protein